MTTDRPYRAALPQEKALGELAKNSGTQFDPAGVEALIGTIAAAKRAPSSSP
jgi:HD-GYP domain-containing protein (c-di-GMP phosphodiesterase class II)